MKEYLASTTIIDWENDNVRNLAQQLATADTIKTAKACFEWVRDNIRHSSDFKMNPVTCKTSEVLHYKTGYCYAKSHLLAALLRANSIPTGFCYQRLSLFDNGAPYCLHGLNAVYLPEYGWYRLDARGNKSGVDAQFAPPEEKLAFGINLTAEFDCQHIFAEPLAVVVQALQKNSTWDEMLHNLPDITPSELSNLDTKTATNN